MERVERKFAGLKLRRQGRTVSFTTPYLAFKLTTDGNPISQKNLKIIFTAGTKPRHWRPGQKTAHSLGYVLHDLVSWTPHYKKSRPVHGILSRDGYWTFEDKVRIYHDGKGWAAQNAEQGSQDLYFMAYGRDYPSAMADYCKVFGKVPLIPKWALGFWCSRYYAYTQKEFLQLADRYRARKMPMDVMVVDTDWRKGVWTGYDWNKKYFPDPDRFVRECRKRGLKISLNDHPGYGMNDPLPKDDSKIAELEKLFGKRVSRTGWKCDWTDERTVKAWKELFLKPKVLQGTDCWWVDGRGSLRGVPGVDKEFEQLWSNMHYYRAASECTKERVMILSRYGGVGSHRFPVGFSGDTKSDWATLKFQVPFTVWGGHQGVLWSHDIGGFLGRKIDRELFVRWSQYGAFSPIFRTHSEHGTREPWAYGRESLDIFRKYARIRQRLIPYLYSYLYRMHECGEPLVRGTFYEFPDDPAAHRFPGQYFLGRDILVAPADGPAGKGRFVKTVYFPAGEWYGLENNDVVQGPAVRRIKTPLSRIPVYVRGGGILAGQEMMKFVDEKRAENIFLDIYPSDGRDGTFGLFEDDGKTFGYQNGKFLKTKVYCRRAGKRIEISLNTAGKGYDGQPRRRRYVCNVRLGPHDRVKSVRVNGHPGGHTFTDRSLGGEIVSGHRFLKLSAAVKRTTEVLIQLA